MSEVKSLRVFRNASNRIFYLKPRPGADPKEKSFLLGPGETVQAMDEAEEKLFSVYGDLRDVAAETPAIGNQISDLQKQLDAEREKNAALTKNSELMQSQIATLSQGKKPK